jgi:hypothetical protein
MEIKSRENRIYRRFDVSTAIEFSFGREEFLNASGLNISKGGFAFVSDRVLDPYSQIVVHLGLPGMKGEEPIGAEAIVLHCRPEGARWVIGVKFTYFRSGDEDRLARFIDREESEHPD